MANRVKRRAREEARLTSENLIRQKLKAHKKQQRRIHFSFLERQAVLAANFKSKDCGISDLLPEQKSLLRFCRRLYQHNHLENYFPVYPSVKEWLADFLKNKFLVALFVGQEKGIGEWMHSGQLIRPISSWKPKFKSNAAHLLWSFAAHCYIRYPHQVPYFLQRLFHNYCGTRAKLRTTYWSNGMKLIFHLAEGKGWHKFSGIEKIKIPSKANFYIQQTPKKLRGNYLTALYWACLRCYISKKMIELFWSIFINKAAYFLKHGIEVLKFIGHQPELSIRDSIKLFYLCDQLMNFMQIHFEEGFEEYYGSVIRFFLKEYQAVEMNEITVWLNYLKQQKDRQTPIKMKGRTIAAFRKKMKQHLKSESIAMNSSSWEGMDKSDYHLSQKNQNYRITQLKTDFDLYVEGQLMSNCVYSYAESCASGECAIWSLQEKVESEKWQPRVTIEVQEQEKIWQTLARFNQPPNQKWKAIIQNWAAEEKLLIP